MIFMCSAKRFFKLAVPFLMLALLFTTGVSAQSKKKTSKKSSAKKSTAQKSKTSSKKKAKKPTAAERRAEAARKKKEEARERAALEAKRKREKAAREARERKAAFERGLRTATVANIAKDNSEGENLAIRRAAISALGNRAGTVVVMDAQTGRIVTMVNHDWAIRDGFKPCSTIKLVTGVAGISESLINGDGTITGEAMKLGLDDALAYSNNAYFQRVGVKMGTDTMIDYAKMLGLGQKTGINAPNEFAGRLPYGNSNPRIYSHADDFEVTPLQLAVMVSALTNGGKRVVPFFARPGYEKASLSNVRTNKIGLPESKFTGVIPGMAGAAEYGTARRGVDHEMGVAGKTGSCIGKGTWVGLFASVAPVKDPRYAVVVITRGQNERGRYAAAVAGKIYEELAPLMTRPTRTIIDSTFAAGPSKPKQDAEVLTASIEEEEEDDESLLEADAEESMNGMTRKRIVVGSAPPTGTVVRPKTVEKKVVKTTSSKPIFKPVVITVKKRPE